MRLSCVLVLGLFVTGFGSCAPEAGAPNVHDTPHRPKTSSQRLTQPRHAKNHRSGLASSSSSTHHRATSADRYHASASGSPRIRPAVLTHRRHHYYERFTASSFAHGDIFDGDITA